MNRSQKYISLLLERLPKWELRSYENQTSLDRIRDRIASSDDIQSELQSLYRVKGFSAFALSLMYIDDKVQKDTTLDESTLAEETLVFTRLRQALGDVPPPAPESTSNGSAFELPTSVGFEPTTTPAPIPTPDVLLDAWGAGTESAAPSPENIPTSERAQELIFAGLLEKFLEAVQGGSDDRSTLMSDVKKECNTVLALSSPPEEYKQFCQLLVEFLQYITDNQFLDDVRVMNIVSNIQDPVSQWARTEPGGRTGLLDPAIEILRDFKTMFE